MCHRESLVRSGAFALRRLDVLLSSCLPLLLIALAGVGGGRAASAQSAVASRVVATGAAVPARTTSAYEAKRTAIDSTRALYRDYARFLTQLPARSPADSLQSGSKQDTTRAIASTLSQLKIVEPAFAAIDISAVANDSLASDAAAHTAVRTAVTRAQEANRVRWILGGTPSLKLSGDGTLGSTLIASARAIYFVPIDSRRPFTLPIVTNLSDLASAADSTRDAKAKKLLSSTEGAYLSIEPTWKPLANKVGDLAVTFALSIAAKVNTLQDSTKKDVTFTQFRFAPSVDVQIGNPIDDRAPLVLTLRPVRSQYSRSTYARIFGDSRSFSNSIESFLIVPIGGGTAMLLEATAGKRSSPLIRLGLFMQAAPKSASATSEKK